MLQYKHPGKFKGVKCNSSFDHLRTSNTDIIASKSNFFLLKKKIKTQIISLCAFFILAFGQNI